MGSLVEARSLLKAASSKGAVRKRTLAVGGMAAATWTQGVVALGGRGYEDGGEVAFAEDFGSEVEFEGVHHHAGAEGDAVEGCAVAAGYFLE
jgi:hypothetical protein